MRHLLLAMLLASCDRGKTEPSEPSGPRATGTLVFDTRPATEADVFLRTEAEVIPSPLLVDRTREENRVELSPSAIRVARRPGTMILDITVLDADPVRAADLCNRHMQTYITYRMGTALAGLQAEMMAVAQLLEKSPEDGELRRKQTDLETKRLALTSGVRVLDTCRPKGRAPATGSSRRDAVQSGSAPTRA